MDRLLRRNTDHHFLRPAGLADLEDQTHQGHLLAHVSALHLRRRPVARVWPHSLGLADHRRQHRHADPRRRGIDPQAAPRLSRKGAWILTHSHANGCKPISMHLPERWQNQFCFNACHQCRTTSDRTLREAEGTPLSPYRVPRTAALFSPSHEKINAAFGATCLAMPFAWIL